MITTRFIYALGLLDRIHLRDRLGTWAAKVMRRYDLGHFQSLSRALS